MSQLNGRPVSRAFHGGVRFHGFSSIIGLLPPSRSVPKSRARTEGQP